MRQDAGIARDMRTRRRRGTALIALAAAAGVAAFAQTEHHILRHERASRYQTIQVVDHMDTGRRVLQFSRSRGIQSSMILDDPDRLDSAYGRSMTAALALHGGAQRALVIGLGGASFPKFLQKHFPDVRLDIVELDPDVVAVAQKYFHFTGSPNTRVFVMDGRLHLKRTREQYDIIFLDAYSGDRIPFHMTTQEFFALVKEHLAPGGVAAMNLWEPVRTRFYIAECRTWQAGFAQTYRFDVDRTGNVILFATTDERVVTTDEWIRRARSLAENKDLGFDLPDLVQRQYEHLTPQAIRAAALTDAMAPVDTLRREHPRYFEEAQRQ